MKNIYFYFLGIVLILALCSPFILAKTTTLNLSISQDTYVQNGSAANTNFATSQNLIVYTNSVGTFSRTYIQINISSLSDKNLTSTKLFLYSFQNPTNWTNVSLYEVNVSWNESLLTWNAQPCGDVGSWANENCSSELIDSKEINSTAKIWYSLDLSKVIRSSYANSSGLVSLVLIGNEVINNSARSLILFKSSNNETYYPRLEVSYSILPNIFVYSPINNSYDTNTILINFSSGGDDNLFYFNGANNISYTSPFFLTAPNGNYHIIFYANNSVGINQTDVYFNVNYIPPTPQEITCSGYFSGGSTFISFMIILIIIVCAGFVITLILGGENDIDPATIGITILIVSLVIIFGGAIISHINTC